MSAGAGWRAGRHRGRCLAVVAVAAVAPAAVGAAAPGSAATAPRTRFALGAGELRLSTARIEAGSRRRVEFTVELTRRAVADGSLALTVPSLWLARAPGGGLAYADVPRSGEGSGRRATVHRDGRTVRFAFRRAERRDSARFTVTDNGLPAGTYRVPFRWREAGRPGSRGTARVIVGARTRATR